MATSFNLLTKQEVGFSGRDACMNTLITPTATTDLVTNEVKLSWMTSSHWSTNFRLVRFVYNPTLPAFGPLGRRSRSGLLVFQNSIVTPAR
jgi:hypothetical protein